MTEISLAGSGVPSERLPFVRLVTRLVALSKWLIFLTIDSVGDIIQ